MSADPFRRITPKTPFRPSAKQQNMWTEAAERVLMGTHRGAIAAGAAIGDSIRIIVKNATEATIDRYGVVALGEPIFDPDVAEDSFTSWKAIQGELPTGCQPIAILQEPLRADDIGTAVVAGVTQVRLEVADEGHLFATPVVGETDRLVSAAIGPARILYKQAAGSGSGSGSGSAYQWALVQLGGVDTGCGGTTPIRIITCVALRAPSGSGSGSGSGSEPPPPPPPP